MNDPSQLVSKSVQQFLDDDCLSSGAAMAFYTVFSLPPMIMIALLITGSLGFTKQDVNRIFHEELGLSVSDTLTGAGEVDESSQADTSTTKEAPKHDARDPFSIGNLGWVSKVAGVLVLLFSASGIFGQLQLTLNRVWEVEPDPRLGGFRSFLMKRLFSAGMVIVIAFILLVSMILTTAMREILKLATGRFPDWSEQALGLILNEATSFGVAVVLFASMFKLLPDAKLAWRDVWVGAVATALMFVIGKAVIAWYLRTFEVGSSWGASAASAVAALVWVYYSSLIVMYGAELANVWSTRDGQVQPPEEGAVHTVKETRQIRAGAQIPVT